MVVYRKDLLKDSLLVLNNLIKLNSLSLFYLKNEYNWFKFSYLNVVHNYGEVVVIFVFSLYNVLNYLPKFFKSEGIKFFGVRNMYRVCLLEGFIVFSYIYDAIITRGYFKNFSSDFFFKFFLVIFSRYFPKLFDLNLSVWVFDTIYIHANVQKLLNIAFVLKNHIQWDFRGIAECFAYDLTYTKKYRFRLVYTFFSVFFNQRLHLVIPTPEGSSVPSLMGIFPGIGWLEREVWDMYGIWFSSNPDLRRILTDYGFSGYPLRKDFPCVGFLEVQYDVLRKHLVYTPVEFSQEMRDFQTVSPWNKWL